MIVARAEEVPDEDASLKCICNEGPANIVLAVTNREKYGRREVYHLSRRYRAEIYLSRLKCFTRVTHYGGMTRTWKSFYVVKSGSLDVSDTIVGFSSTHLVTAQEEFAPDYVLMDFYELSPQFAVHKNQIRFHDCEPFSQFDVRFDPHDRFISTLVYNREDARLSCSGSCSVPSVFRVFTLFPDRSLCLSMRTPSTIVCRKSQISGFPMSKEYLRIYKNGFVLNTGVSLIVIRFSNSLPLKVCGQKTWRVVKDIMPYRSCVSSSVLLEIGEELAVESSCVYANESERMTYFLVNCETNQEQPCGLRHPLFVSRQEMSVENLIDNIVTSFLRRTKELEQARYRGSWDYETDVHHIDDQSICTIIIVCICEIELPMKGSESTRDIFYLCELQTRWDIISGLSFGGECHVMRELPQKNLFTPSLWYPFEKFPVEKEVHSFNIRCEEVYFGKEEVRLMSSSGCSELILNFGL